MLRNLKRLFKDEKGQDMIEYGLLASFISIVAIGVIMLIATPLIALYQAVVDAL
jgi:Flp pilus assembly pilin Flp